MVIRRRRPPPGIRRPPTSYLMHISITTGRATVWEPRAVTEAEYNAGS